MLDTFKNGIKTTVSTGYNSSATSIVLSTGDGAKLPAVPFNAVWFNATDYSDPSDDPNVEIVRVTAISTDTLTISRAAETMAANSTAQNHNTAAKVYKLIPTLTAKTLNTDLFDVFTVTPWTTNDVTFGGTAGSANFNNGEAQFSSSSSAGSYGGVTRGVCKDYTKSMAVRVQVPFVNITSSNNGFTLHFLYNASSGASLKIYQDRRSSNSIFCNTYNGTTGNTAVDISSAFGDYSNALTNRDIMVRFIPGVSVVVYINGVAVATFTTNLFSGTTTDVINAFGVIVNTYGGGSVSTVTVEPVGFNRGF